MSTWDWIHAGLELATFTQVRSAQQTLAGMKTAADMEAARRAMLEAMRTFVVTTQPSQVSSGVTVGQPLYVVVSP